LIKEGLGLNFNLQNLRTIMDDSNINKHYYSIYPDENFYTEVVTFIRKKADKWEIGVKERCEDCDIKQFNTEAEACQAFLEEFYPEILNGPKCL
jgi:hypothetical protein